MYTRILVASLAALFFTAAPATAQPQPPDGTVWKTENGLCQPSDGDIDGCSFGPAAAGYKSGIAYFRVCGQIHEARPFLIVNILKREFVLDRKNGRPLQVWPFRRGKTTFTPQDVAAFADMVEDKHQCIAV